MGTRNMIVFFVGAALLVVLTGAPLGAAGNIDSAKSFAWSENAGWINCNPEHGGVSVTRTHLSGFAWAENIGWIKLGAGAGPYANTGPDNWGVNLSGSRLSGFAWSENAGWIAFRTGQSRVTVDPATGWLDGYAWGENIGWIHFRNETPAYGVRTTANLTAGSILLVR